MKEPVVELTKPDACLLARIGRKNNLMPASQYWDTFTRLHPGHYYATDLNEVRGKLLREHICPKVLLSGMGVIKGLVYNDCHVHKWPHDAHICLKFLEEYSKLRHHSLAYRGESLSTFCQMIFDDLCRQTDRPFICLLYTSPSPRDRG